MGIFKGPKTPKPQPVVPLPDDNDPAVLRAKRMSILAAQSQSGRQSTILSTNADDSLGSAPGGLR
jgi:hypothetical protein